MNVDKELKAAYVSCISRWFDIREVCRKWRRSDRYMPEKEHNEFIHKQLLNSCELCTLMSNRGIACEECPAAEDLICHDDYDGKTSFKIFLRAVQNQHWVQADTTADTILKWLTEQLNELKGLCPEACCPNCEDADNCKDARD